MGFLGYLLGIKQGYVVKFSSGTPESRREFIRILDENYDIRRRQSSGGIPHAPEPLKPSCLELVLDKIVNKLF